MSSGGIIPEPTASPTPEPSASPTPDPSASPNQPPYFGPTLFSFFVGEGLPALTAYDPDRNPLTFSLIGGNLPPGITLNADGTFSGVGTTAGHFDSPLVKGCDPFGACVIEFLGISFSEPSVSPSPSASPVVTPTPQPKASTPPQPKKSTPLANTSMEGPLGGTPASLPEILLGLLLLSLGAGPLASRRLRRRFLRQR